ncbi:MAG: chromate efflux transporter [Desulfuromonadales bacterium]
MSAPNPEIDARQPPIEQGAGVVFLAFLRLGLTSFGGPIAHLGYFRREFVEKRAWFSDSQYAQLVGLCQFLPGPASSQLGFSIGLLRAGLPGALAAFIAFTLPSALLLLVFARIAPIMTGPVGLTILHGLKLVALAVVAHGVISMAQRLCPGLRHRLIAAGAAVLVVLATGAGTQIVVILLGALCGFLLLQDGDSLPETGLPVSFSRKMAGWLIAIFLGLLVGLPLLRGLDHGLLAVFEAFYRAGALVFGGGHVVLPLLEEAVVTPGWLTRSDFMAGYGAAQAIPGPMFSFAAYLGAHLPENLGGLVGATMALSAIFLPGFLLVAAALPLWHVIAGHPQAIRAIGGINAAVVGLLAAALYDPVWTSAVHDVTDVGIAVVGFLMLAVGRFSALIVVVWCLLASGIASYLSFL